MPTPTRRLPGRQPDSIRTNPTPHHTTHSTSHQSVTTAYRAVLDGNASPQMVLQLQRTAGNRAVHRLLAGVSAPRLLQRVYDPDAKLNKPADLIKLRTALLEEFPGDTLFIDAFMSRHEVPKKIEASEEVVMGRAIFAAKTVKQKQEIDTAKTGTAISGDLKTKVRDAIKTKLERARPKVSEQQEFLSNTKDKEPERLKGTLALQQFDIPKDIEIEVFLNHLFIQDAGAKKLAKGGNFNLLVNYCYGRWQKHIQKGETYFVDEEEKGPHETTLGGRTMNENVPDIALGYTWVPDFKPEQLTAMQSATTLGVNNVPPSELDPLTKNPLLQTLGRDHHLQDFVKGLETHERGTHPVYFHQWVEWGLATKFDVYDNWSPWQRAFESAIDCSLKLGGKIYFNLAGFPKHEIDEVRNSKFYLPWHNAENPDQSFKKEHGFKGLIPGTKLGVGLRITHWEIAQVMHNKNMWDNTIFCFYEKDTGVPRRANTTDLSNLGIEFLGNSNELGAV